MGSGGDSRTISPTAHYTGAVWARAGLSHPALETLEGRVLYNVVRPLMVATDLVGGMRLQDFLLARHRIIDHLLVDAIEAGRVRQVIEIAAGMSPRGWRFSERYGDEITYVEADLPDMAKRKRDALDGAGLLTEGHRVADLDALRDEGELSLGAIADALDPALGTAMITEGLLNYFDREAVEGLWARIARSLDRFPQGLYLSDLHLEQDSGGTLSRGFSAALGVFVRGRVHLHFADEAEAVEQLRSAGFAGAVLHSPPEFADRIEGCDRAGAQVVRIVEAQTTG